MRGSTTQRGLAELRAVRRESRGLYWFAGIFSFFVNMLMLTGPLYMLQVYDRVLGSRSLETLVALSVLVAFLFLMMGLLDYVRGRIMARVGARFQAKLDQRVFDAVVRRSSLMPDEKSETGLRDLESIQRLLSSPVLMAVFDIPWAPVFFAAIFVFHPWLGILALIGGGFLILMTVINQITTKLPTARAQMAAMRSNDMSNELRKEAEMLTALGMRDHAFARWQERRAEALAEQIGSSDLSGTFTAITKTFRLFLQSAMLGLGAYLVLQGELTPGAMIAGSILMGRALAPVELAIGQWAMVQQATRGWHSLAELLGEIPPRAQRMDLPRPEAKLEVIQVTVAAPGERTPALRGVNFTLPAGHAVGVIGPSGAGKTTLARAISGVWPVAAGKIRLGGATLDQFEPDVLGQHIGYLPQRVQLFDGTIAENIAKLQTDYDAQQVVAAAKKAAAHEMIMKLPEGYDTKIGMVASKLSGGQLQRIGLARAMYGNPVLLVLDEPNSNLDNEGSEAVNTAIREVKKAGGSVLVMAHRPAAIKECDLLLMLENGTMRAYGPKEKVLREVVQNHGEIAQSKGMGGVR